jgi:hypothetical protein
VTHKRQDSLRVPDLLLERYRLGEVTGAEKLALDQRLAGDPELRARLDALGASDAGIQKQYRPAWLADRIRARAATRPSIRPARARRLGWRPLAVAGAAALVVVIAGLQLVHPPVRPAQQVANPDTTDADRIKGQPLQLFRKTARGSEALGDGAMARRGDVIRLAYRAGGRAFGVIVSIDGRGMVTPHLPERGRQAVALGREGQVLLDHAYELDDAPRWEVFYFVTGRNPFDLGIVEQAVREAAARMGQAVPGALALSPALGQSRFVLMKEAGQ